MSFRPSEKDHQALDSFLETVLDAYKDDRISLIQAVGELAHVMTAAAIDNETEFLAHLRMSEDQLFRD